MKKVLCLTIVLLMMLSLLTACGTAKETESKPAEAEAKVEAEVKEEAAVEPIVWRYSLDNNENSANYKAAKYFTDLVYERTNGRYRIDIYPNAVLMSAADGIEGTQMGAIEMNMVNVSILCGNVPEYDVFNLPFLIESNEHADKVLLGDSQDYWLGLLEQSNLVGILPFETGWRCFSNSKHEVKSVDDIAGLRLRVMENPLMIEAWQMMGADPVPMSWGEAFTAMQQGAIDGQDNPPAITYTNGTYEVNDYFSEINYIYSWIPTVVNMDAWNALSDEDKEIFKQASDEASIYQRELIRAETDVALANMEEKGMEVVPFSEVDAESFRNAIAPMLDKYYDQFAEQIDVINSYK